MEGLLALFFLLGASLLVSVGTYTMALGLEIHSWPWLISLWVANAILAVLARTMGRE